MGAAPGDFFSGITSSDVTPMLPMLARCSQIARYDDMGRADSLHLVIFDRRPEYRAKPWEERLAREARTTAAGKPVAIILVLNGQRVRNC